MRPFFFLQLRFSILYEMNLFHLFKAMSKEISFRQINNLIQVKYHIFIMFAFFLERRNTHKDILLFRILSVKHSCMILVAP
jgi:hypothetical protein